MQRDIVHKKYVAERNECKHKKKQWISVERVKKMVFECGNKYVQNNGNTRKKRTDKCGIFMKAALLEHENTVVILNITKWRNLNQRVSILMNYQGN